MLESKACSGISRRVLATPRCYGLHLKCPGECAWLLACAAGGGAS